jgi:hypothetical protein
VASGLDGLLKTDIAGQNNDVGDRGTGLGSNRFQHAEHLGKTLRLIAFPVLLRSKANARAIGAAALVRTTESASAESQAVAIISADVRPLRRSSP